MAEEKYGIDHGVTVTVEDNYGKTEIYSNGALGWHECFAVVMKAFMASQDCGPLNAAEVLIAWLDENVSGWQKDFLESDECACGDCTCDKEEGC